MSIQHMLLVLSLNIAVLDGKTSSFVNACSCYLSPEHINWPSRSIRNIFSTSGRFIASNNIATRFQISAFSAYVAFPRMKPGVPITLGKVSLLPKNKFASIEPYPSWDMQEEGHKDSLQNAVDLYIDEKKVLWVLDTGWVNTFTNPVIKGRPRVFGINTRNGRVLYDVDLSRFATPASKFQYVVAENTLNRPVLFIADSASCAVVVWDVQKEKGGIIPLPNPGSSEDSLYMVLLRPAKTAPMIVFSYLANPQLFGVSVEALRHGQIGDVRNLGSKTGEMIILGTDNGSKIFFRWKGDNQVRMWDLGDHVERGLTVGSADIHRTSTHVAGGGVGLLTWTLESNFPDFIQGNVGSIGASAVLKPLGKDE